ncbi:unnamed protein product, partial [Chrysoparadoxa australica]
MRTHLSTVQSLESTGSGFTSKVFPLFDGAGMTCFMDAEKGGESAFRATFQHAAHFECSLHLGKNISARGWRGGGEWRKAFLKAVHAITLADLKLAIDSFPSGLKTYLHKRDYHEMFPVARLHDWKGDHDIAEAGFTNYPMFGYTSSQLVEAMNSANQPV